MNRRVLITAIAAALSFAVTCAVWLWLQEPETPLQLRVVRQTLEDGKPIAYFEARWFA
jgi:hypothetical protein